MIVIGANSDSFFQRLMKLINRSDLANNPELATSNAARVQCQTQIDNAIEAWTRQHTVEHVLESLQQEGIPCEQILCIREIVQDPHYQARNMFEPVPLECEGSEHGKVIRIPAMSPKLSQSPGKTQWGGPRLGQHTSQVLRERLGLSQADIDQLEENKIIKQDHFKVVQEDEAT